MSDTPELITIEVLLHDGRESFIIGPNDLAFYSTPSEQAAAAFRACYGLNPTGEVMIYHDGQFNSSHDLIPF